jgi:DNA-directed RNA polymerase specialized sigma24 family protein
MVARVMRRSSTRFGPKAQNLVAPDEALKVLETVDRRKGQVEELRFIRGFSVDETADARQVSADTVTRDWHFAKAWLQNHELRREAR